MALMDMISIIGAALCLGAFIASNLNILNTKGLSYAAMNCLGTGLLALTVLEPLNIGVLTVEVVWCAFSAYLIYQALTRSSHHG